MIHLAWLGVVGDIAVSTQGADVNGNVVRSVFGYPLRSQINRLHIRGLNWDLNYILGIGLLGLWGCVNCVGIHKMDSAARSDVIRRHNVLRLELGCLRIHDWDLEVIRNLVGRKILLD